VGPNRSPTRTPGKTPNVDKKGIVNQKNVSEITRQINVVAGKKSNATEKAEEVSGEDYNRGKL